MDRYFNDREYRKEIAKTRKQQPWFPQKYKKIVLALVAVILVGLFGFIIYLFQGLPSIQELENPRTAIASEVRSRDGVVLDRYFIENRTHVSVDQISPNVLNALIATEDHRFFNHWGVDTQSLMRLPYYWLQQRFQGGSTISQQLARNLYRKIGFEVSITRKLREMITAVQIEHNYTKQEILEMYLNTVEFSNSAFGIESAARTHYGKPAAELDLLEAATLIGQLRAVFYYNPRIYPERAQGRRNIVLSLMAQHGFISDEQYATVQAEEVTLNYHPPSRSGRESRYFGEYIRQQVRDWVDENGFDLYSDGLVIYTTIDSRLQRHAEQAVQKKIVEFQERFEQEWTTSGGDYMDRLWQSYPAFLPSFIRDTDRYRNGFTEYDTDQSSVVMEHLLADEAFVDSVKQTRTKLQASFTALDPSNGNILVWVGGTDYGTQQFDHVHQSRRQAGSTFKPFVYAVAIDNGYMPYHRFSKYPISFIEASGRMWNPKDPSVPAGPEMVPLREALARSLNNVTVRLLPEIAGAPGTNRASDLEPAARLIKNMAENLGMDMSNYPDYPSIALGTAEVSLLELVSAYTTFVNQGVHIEPNAITRIEDKEGNVLVEYFPEYRQEAISPETAYMMVDMMRGVIRGGENYNGTGVRLRNLYNIQQDIAGKTGTTQNSADNWFVAMMPHIVMGSWVGGEDRRIRFPTNSPGSIGQGARTALPIVGEFINNATSDPDTPWSYDAFTPPQGFSMPEDPANNAGAPQRRERIGW